MRMPIACLAAALAVVPCGCGDKGPKLAPVTGTVTRDGEPLVGAQVTFVPTGATAGRGATGRTGEGGKYTLKAVGGGEGVPAGEYKVVISHRVLPGGKVLDEDAGAGAEDSPAKETLPEGYSNPERTTLTAKVPEGGDTIDFPLKVRKR